MDEETRARRARIANRQGGTVTLPAEEPEAPPPPKTTRRPAAPASQE